MWVFFQTQLSTILLMWIYCEAFLCGVFYKHLDIALKYDTLSMPPIVRLNTL